jgi:DNA-binding NtrC family response regulator
MNSGVQVLIAKILLVTDLDTTHRRLLLESQGHEVTLASGHQVSILLREEEYDLALVSSEQDATEIVSLCEQMKVARPGMRVAVVVHTIGPVPASSAIDAVIDVPQQGPARFLAEVETQLRASKRDRRSRWASDAG